MSVQQYRVMKFGGSSVGTVERLTQVVEIIARERAMGPLAVVVSAMGDTTDWLIEAVDAASIGDSAAALAHVDRAAELAVATATTVHASFREPRQSFDFRAIVNDVIAPLRQAVAAEALFRGRSAAFRDFALSFGERLSATLVTQLLEARGVAALAVDARDWTLTDDTFGSARVFEERTYARVRALAESWNDRVPVNTGFIGRTSDGRTTTLGRNGSDFTAALLAAALSARDLTVWTDVSGVLTADPKLVAEAYPVPHLSHQEALELANLGFAMFHPRTMLPLIQANVPLRIRNTLQPEDAGTLVDAAGSSDTSRPSCIVTVEDLALVDVEYAPRSQHFLGIGQRVLKALDQAGIVVRVSTQQPLGRAVAATIPAKDVERAKSAIQEELASDYQRGDVEPIRVRAPVTLITLMAETAGRGTNVAGRFFGALGAVGINVRAAAQGAASRSIACVVDAAESTTAVRTVHTAFNLAHAEASVLILGKGVVGGQLIAQIQAQQEKLRSDDGVFLKVVGIASSDRCVFNEAGIDLSRWKEQLEAAPRSPMTVENLEAALERLERLPLPIMVDCTAAGGTEEYYVRAFARGIHVVAANKKPLALPQQQRDALMAAAKRHHRFFFYETTVGASLPVINTLIDFVRTGDRVRLIEGSFSGTLGYLANELMRGVPLSEAVADAKARGYTEPHPRDDLSGLDVARKAVILAREIGLEVELDDVQVEPFVPADLLKESDPEAFLRSLKLEDASMSAYISRLRSENKVLRYLARIDPSAPGGRKQLVKVGPVAVDADHPATRLRGSEAFVAFTTERYSDYPLVVQGSGAGGAVTAAGVLADTLKIAQTLRGR
jgi:aspartokinase/homoserine dehydrogenase 1